MKKILMALSMLALAGSSYAQYGPGQVAKYFENREKGKKQNFAQSTSLHIGSLVDKRCDFNWDYFNRNSDGTYTGMGNISQQFKAKGIFYGASSYIRLFNITDNSALAFDLGVSAYSMYAESLGEMRIGNSTYTSLFASANILVPLAIDYKFGGEANNDKAEHFSFTIGAGVCPVLSGATFAAWNDMSATIKPYVHGEIGFFAGVEFKVKVDYLAGTARYMSADYRDFGGMPEGSVITVTGRPALAISFAVIPFSFDWENSVW